MSALSWKIRRCTDVSLHLWEAIMLIFEMFDAIHDPPPLKVLPIESKFSSFLQFQNECTLLVRQKMNQHYHDATEAWPSLQVMLRLAVYFSKCWMSSTSYEGTCDRK
ncbi:hypothetical protein RHMOL_Rhmol07G0036400 [Rhododendron molle]|uniref:Uncharacterized protein n=2 Tax=Rhododendron molle TaxID=49168 RepID=A0ACC0MWK7_RHOML|nr:hypothetical protein RHMOL_Rhmol07G0036400 [Rhododendron molle]KAI8545398.1 hypothetical protein RHMOL_Rhmol07G0036400 [Rhododendron molle]